MSHGTLSDEGVRTPAGRLRLTVVVTTYERPDYLRQSLATIAAQSARGSFKVVVQDNASMADYSGVIAEFADGMDLEYVRNETNIGATGNIKRALARYRDTEYLTIFHDDDLMHPRMLEWQLRQMDSNAEILFVATQCIIFSDGTPPPIDRWEELATPVCDVYPDAAAFVRGVLGGSEPCLSSVMYRTNVLDRVQVDFERFNLYWDRPYLVDIARLGKSALMKSPLVLYRIHGAQDSVSGALTVPIAMTLMESYRDVLDSDTNAENRDLLLRWSTTFLSAIYGMVGPAKRPPLFVFLLRARARRVFRLRILTKEQWLQLLRDSGHAWVPDALVRAKRVAMWMLGK